MNIIQNSMKFSTECFSGECGLCKNCCQNTEESLQKNIHNKPESERRSEDLSKIIGKNNVQEFKDRYNKNLKEWCKNYSFKDPFCYGYAPKNKRETFTGRNEKYKIIDKIHKDVCDNLYCKMMYTTSTSWEQEKKYCLLPVYKNINEEKYLCGPCLTNDSFK